ncbi:MAG: phosphate acyltransferase [Coxiella sp. (in: Bacteria)]|nr:MAG: phosphate acyltransferase [Coxiella sp. (in: g-proteobacteria)]
MTDVVVSIDAMGGDHGPRVTIPAALKILEKHENLKLILVGKEDILHAILQKHKAQRFMDRWSVVNATEVVAMDESPALALRNKKDSAMRVSINQVKEGNADACVSAGNTGALMATARFVLKMIPGIDRPAITTQFPTRSGRPVRVLDLGANVDSKVEHLYQFAVMGSILAHAVDNIDSPSVGLLNIGEEDNKGNEQVKQAGELLAKSDALNYIGFVEGNDIFTGKVDVVVCDGFVGNIVLKACEGISKMIGQFLRESFMHDTYSKLIGVLSRPVLKRLRKKVDPRHHNGATLIGLNGIVVKSHGSAGVFAFGAAIEEAIIEVEKDVVAEIREKVKNVLQENNE